MANGQALRIAFSLRLAISVVECKIAWSLAWMKRLRQMLLFGCSLLLLLLSTVTVAVAQELSDDANRRSDPQVEQVFSGHSGLDADDISSEKISQFVKAYLQVLRLSDEREEELEGAETESESLQVQHDIETEAIAIIESSALTWQEYLQLRDLANVDPEFGERIAAQLQEAES